MVRVDAGVGVPGMWLACGCVPFVVSVAAVPVAVEVVGAWGGSCRVPEFRGLRTGLTSIDTGRLRTRLPATSDADLAAAAFSAAFGECPASDTRCSTGVRGMMRLMLFDCKLE